MHVCASELKKEQFPAPWSVSPLARVSCNLLVLADCDFDRPLAIASEATATSDLTLLVVGGHWGSLRLGVLLLLVVLGLLPFLTFSYRFCPFASLALCLFGSLALAISPRLACDTTWSPAHLIVGWHGDRRVSYLAGQYAALRVP